MNSLVDPIFWMGLGVVATLICAFVAERNGFLQISIMRQAHTLNVSKATPRIGFHCTVSTLQKLPAGFNPHLVIAVEIYNEGELAVQNVQGYWQYRPPNVAQKIVHNLHRDFLGNCEKYTDTYVIDTSPNWPLGTGQFDVDVEFFYRVPGTPEQQHYQARYSYNPNGQQMVRITD